MAARAYSRTSPASRGSASRVASTTACQSRCRCSEPGARTRCSSTLQRPSSAPRTASSSSFAQQRSPSLRQMNRRAWLAFAALSLIWGVPYLFIKVAVDGDISPFFLAWARLVLGASLLFAIVPRQGLEMLRHGPRRWILAYATAEMVLPFPLIAAGEQHVDSSVAAIVIATVPLLIALLALRFDHTERPTRTRMVGMLIGLVGVMALVGIDLSGRSDERLAAGAIMVPALGSAAGPMIIKRHLLEYDARATMAASLTVAAVLLTP